jgi:ankyrin repeat protein
MQDKYGETALITACFNGHLETAKLLLHRDALVNYQGTVRILHSTAGKFDKEFNLAVWWSAFVNNQYNEIYCILVSSLAWISSQLVSNIS